MSCFKSWWLLKNWLPALIQGFKSFIPSLRNMYMHSLWVVLHFHITPNECHFYSTFVTHSNLTLFLQLLKICLDITYNTSYRLTHGLFFALLWAILIILLLLFFHTFTISRHFFSFSQKVAICLLQSFEKSLDFSLQQCFDYAFPEHEGIFLPSDSVHNSILFAYANLRSHNACVHSWRWNFL